MASEPEVAWAAGIFEGEGSIVLRHGLPVAQVRNNDREVLDRFAEIVGVGTVYGPYANRAGERDGYARNPYFHWTASAGDSESVLVLLWSWLTERRRRRAFELGFDYDVETAAVEERR